MSVDSLDGYSLRVNRPYVDYIRRLGMNFEAVEAHGAIIKDSAGREYIDCIGGYGNANIGHNHARVVEALVRELKAGRPNGWPFIPQAHVRLTEKLVGLAPAGIDRCFIVNSGAEAVDSALKLVRLATGRQGIIACEGGWHGFTMGALSVSEPSGCTGFGPLLPGVRRVPYGNAAAAAEAISQEIGAIIVESVQSESGAIEPPPGYLKELAAICSRSGALLLVDEIKTGIGKTGNMFACEFEGVEPDVLLAGKSLGGGMPIGVMLVKSKWWAKFGWSFAMSSSSNAGNRLACVAALAALEAIETENLCANAANLGLSFQRALHGLSCAYPDLIKGTSGRGLLLGLHTANPRIASEIVVHCVRDGVLVMPAFLKKACLLIEPPLCITGDQAGHVIRALEQACQSIAARTS